MSQSSTLWRARTQAHSGPRPLSERVVNVERTRERVTHRWSLPTPLLTFAQRVGRRPGLVDLGAAGVGVFASWAQQMSPMFPPILLGVLLVLAGVVMSVSAVVRLRVRAGVQLRPAELAIDTDQAIPAAALAPVAALVGWMLATLLL